ncbi:unnamed protein product, partial [Didymodactylos carnosus]
LYGIAYQDYKKIFEDAPILPPNCHLTSYGVQFIRQPQYESIINQKNNDESNTSDADVNVDIDTGTNTASNQPLLNYLDMPNDAENRASAVVLVQSNCDDDKTASTAEIRDDEISIDDRITYTIADTNTSSSSNTKDIDFSSQKPISVS